MESQSTQHPRGLTLGIKYVPLQWNEWDLIRAIASALHSPEFDPKVSDEGHHVLNFSVNFSFDEKTAERKAYLTLPTDKEGRKVNAWFRDHPLKAKRTKLRFFTHGPPREYEALTLQRTPFMSPDVEEEHQKKINDLNDQLRIEEVQFGVFYRPSYPTKDNPKGSISRAFSVEWSRDFASRSAAWLHFEYEHKLIRIVLGDRMTEAEGRTIGVNIASIIKIGVGYDMGRPYICFDTTTPPILELIQFNRTLTGDHTKDNKKYKQRIASLPGHERVAPFAHKLRLVLHKPLSALAEDIIDQFCRLCEIAGIAKSVIMRCYGPYNIEASGQNFFAEPTLFKLRKSISPLEWTIAFQLELLLYNGLLLPWEIENLLPHILQLRKVHHPCYVGDLLRCYALDLTMRPPTQSPFVCFENSKRHFTYQDSSTRENMLQCYHVTFTPTRVLLEGPYPTQSNRVLRKFPDKSEHFVRVDFRDDDKLNYRWDRAVDGVSFLKEHVGGILKNGFHLAGRDFEFLAYSSSALREHTVWFVNPFDHFDDKEKRVKRMDAATIRASLGDFENTLNSKGVPLTHFPSKFAARLAQAFTATDSSVKIKKCEWEEVADLGRDPYLFTDGVGTISEALGNKIWEKLCNDRPGRRKNSVKPSAYQIRFLGFKGVVSIDCQMDRDFPGIHMRLRPSMKKFENKDVEVADIEIAKAFERPNTTNLNKSLVMILEDEGVKRDAFEELQQNAVVEARNVHYSLEQFRKVMEAHGMGYSSGYRLPYLTRKLEEIGLDLNKSSASESVETPFLRQLRQVTMTDALREIKHDARIHIPESFKLVGVADEGPAYQALGYENVYVLQAGFIYACVQYPEDETPTWIKGNCTISRSPVVHPGDVQRVHAIGEPPAGMLCLFRHLKNVVVFPSIGRRSMPSCLAGGDLDGDEYDIIMDENLLPTVNVEPMSYAGAGTFELDRPSDINDICDFVVQYIHSDVLGLLSDRLLVIADQSLEGIFDPDCAKLAKLCSQAVDYPKQGIPVDIDGQDQLPSTLIRRKPDWHAAEVVSPRKTDYYQSTRALGYLFRVIQIDDPEDITKELSERQASLPRRYLNDPISSALYSHIKQYGINPVVVEDPNSSIAIVFKKYTDELRYICMTHTISNTPGVLLLEAEVVVGAILAKCSQKRWRKERAWRMRTHSAELVHDIQRQLSPPDRDEPLTALEKAWQAWNYSLRHQRQFGANSFGLIALGIIFDCMEKLAGPQSE